MIHRLFPLGLVLVLPACSLHVPMAGRLDTSLVQTVVAPLDRTWNSLPDAYESAGIPVEAVEAKEYRLWSTTTMPAWELLYGAQGTYPVRCTLPELPSTVLFAANLDAPRARILPLPDRAVGGTVTISITTELGAKGDLTSVITRVRATPVAESSTSEPGWSIHCASTGVWEARVHDALVAELEV